MTLINYLEVGHVGKMGNVVHTVDNNMGINLTDSKFRVKTA